jgi:hypothetical protein
MKNPRVSCVLAFLLVVAATRLTAVPIGLDLGTSAPPATLGGYAMGAFNDPTADMTDVTSIQPPATSPVTGELTFDNPVTRFTTGSTWATWSHGYSGAVYWLDEVLYGKELELFLPVSTKAFLFYLEPDEFNPFEFTLTATDSLGAVFEFLDGGNPWVVGGEAGARGFGFYVDNPELSLASLTIAGYPSDPEVFSNGFAVGEFAINHVPVNGVPDGGTTLLLLAGTLVLIGMSRRHLQA